MIVFLVCGFTNERVPVFIDRLKRWKSSGVSPDACGLTAKTAHVRHT